MALFASVVYSLAKMNLYRWSQRADAILGGAGCEVRVLICLSQYQNTEHCDRNFDFFFQKLPGSFAFLIREYMIQIHQTLTQTVIYIISNQ